MKNFKIQDFGHILIVDLNLNIIGVSKHLLVEFNIPVESLLGTPVEGLLLHLPNSSSKKIRAVIHSFVEGNPPRALLTVRIQQKLYYLKISKHENYIYIEAERQLNKKISTRDLEDIGFLFENRYHPNWNFVCKAINRILHFDRVFIVQQQDMGNCKVLAETNNGQLESYADKNFSKEFLPPYIIDYYSGTSYRYIENTIAPPQDFYSLTDVDLNITQITSYPQERMATYRLMGIGTVVSFPLYLQGKFWGLVIANNRHVKPIDLQNRKICTFIVQNAMSKYETFVKEGQLNINTQIQTFQHKLLERLTHHKTINCALVESMENLRLMMNSDGIAIYNEGDIYLNGKTPSANLFFEIIHFLQNSNKEVIYKDHNFKLRYQAFFRKKLPFAGLLAYNVDSKKDYYIVWFRQESPYKETHIEICTSPDEKLMVYENDVYHVATPWNDEELTLLEGLQNTLNHSLIEKFFENKIKTKNLSELNNELEMFTYTLSHDIKNPLSVLKMGIDFLKSKEKHSAPNERKWLNTLSQGISNIEEIINNILHVSHHKVDKIPKESIPLKYLLRKIVAESKLAYKADSCQVTFGNLLPIWGEKSAIYQIFTNIISNAIKYAQGRKLPKIHIQSTIKEGMIQYEVMDNGIGIPKNDLDRIFDMFGRAQNATSYAGSGIGLALVKRIIDRLDGEIEIESREGIGTKVIMRFPNLKEDSSHQKSLVST